MATRPPTVRRRRLGVQLRKIREDRGLTLDEAAAFLKISKSALSRMENAQIVARAHEINYILMMRHKQLGVGANYGEYVHLEQDSSQLFAYHVDLIHGLLQTPEYARAVMSSVPSNAGRDIDRAVAYRMARKDALTRADPLELSVVIGEAAVCQLTGGREVMVAQLRHLLEQAEHPNVNIQILPFAATRNPGVDGSFAILHVEA
jgi:transcriptional regulator with XRE-family HTH domain